MAHPRHTIDQIKAVLQDSDSLKEAAAKLGLRPHSIRARFHEHGIGLPTQWLGKMRLKGASTLRDANGHVEHEWQKTERAPVPAAIKPSPPGFSVSRVSTMRDREGLPIVQWVQENKAEVKRLEEFWAAAAKASKAVEACPEINREKKCGPIDANLLSLYPLGDPHLGQLSWKPETGADFDIKIACKELLTAVKMLVNAAPPARRGVLAPLGDNFHAEDDNQLTPRNKHKLDVDSRSDKVIEAGFFLVESMTLELLKKHEEVDLAILGGNHDPRLARLLRMWATAVFRNNRRVRVLDNRDPYMYIRHGKTLIGLTHGDGCKDEALPGIMAEYNDGQWWGQARHRVWHRGHHHQDGIKEFRGCKVEQHQTLAARDYHAQHSGYRSGRGLKVISYDKLHGEITRTRVDIRQVQEESNG